MLNDVWLKIAQFLGTLNGENVKRESYVRTLEFEAALEDFASAQEKRAYIPGYVDCVQVLYHMELLKENEGLKWAE